MPVLVLGADTAAGAAVTRALESRAGERRAFVTDPEAAESLRSRGWKVAKGDVSDGSHVGGAAAGSFSVVVVPEAAFDGRERAFAHSPAATMTAWADALRTAEVHRIIVVEDRPIAGLVEGFRSAAPEVAVVPAGGRPPDRIAAEVARLDDLASLDEV